jgi:hypothetical protein
MKKRLQIGALACLLLLGAMAAVGSAEQDEAARTEPTEAKDPAGSAAQRVELDPLTGERLAEPTESSVPLRRAEDTSERFSRRIDGLYAETLPNGAVMVDLRGRFMSAVKVTIDENGNVAKSCELVEVEPADGKAPEAEEVRDAQ